MMTDELLDYLASKFEEISQPPATFHISFIEFVEQWVGQTEYNMMQARGVNLFGTN